MSGGRLEEEDDREVGGVRIGGMWRNSARFFATDSVKFVKISDGFSKIREDQRDGFGKLREDRRDGFVQIREDRREEFVQKSKRKTCKLLEKTDGTTRERVGATRLTFLKLIESELEVEENAVTCGANGRVFFASCPKRMADPKEGCSENNVSEDGQVGGQ